MTFNVSSKEKEIQRPSPTVNYHFIDFVRFMSTIGIISLHSIYFGLPENVLIEDFLKQTDRPIVLIIFLQLMRFSVISFYIMSGFLIAKKARTENHLRLFYKRIKVTLPAYAVAFILTALYWYTREIYKEENPNLLSILLHQLFQSSFWYVPNSLLSLLLILILLKKLRPLYLGALFFIGLIITTIKYVYITPTGHSNPVFFMAFAFYIWVGGFFWQHNLSKYIKTIDIKVIFAVWFSSFVLFCGETYILWKKNYPMIIQNLKVTNQIYAVVSFILLIRISDYIKPFFIVNPRKESYGIYLYSPLVGFIVGVTLHRIIGYFYSTSTLMSIAYIFVHFTITYITTTWIVKLIIKHRLLFLHRS